eukprot:CAMPEP_0185834942 /NCGR_PEP_ID=MMETSP1353-20130828/6651_1 /TAXON_ID=1077150 /ORGANISM="Erythrolobus australicus, Strain CCMP3124" /LENGTH=71 /DNA_ID=CAMNT_0028533477 /DNA_START=310 /DNA_END=522 /DNA_ORIENTATION=+
MPATVRADQISSSSSGEKNDDAYSTRYATSISGSTTVTAITAKPPRYDPAVGTHAAPSLIAPASPRHVSLR